MAVLLYFLMSFFIVIAGFTLIGITFYGWRQESKRKKAQNETLSMTNPAEPAIKAGLKENLSPKVLETETPQV